MLKVLKVSAFGQVLEEGILTCNLFINAKKTSPQVVFVFKGENSVVGMDNEQNLYLAYGSVYTQEGKISRVGDNYVYYHSGSSYDNGKISKVGSTYIFYWSDTDIYYGKVKSINGKSVYYWNDASDGYYGNVKSFNDVSVFYWNVRSDSDYGKVKTIGDLSVYYDYSSGKVKTIGGASVYYSYDGRVSSVGGYSL